jgi:hypothetical protein
LTLLARLLPVQKMRHLRLDQMRLPHRLAVFA